MSALGMIETRGLAVAVEALDAMLDGAARWSINRRGSCAYGIDSQANRQGLSYLASLTRSW